MCEYRTYHKCMPLMNRLDYLAGEVNNFGFCLAVEKLLGVEVPKRAQYIRVMMAELTRIASHLFWLGTHGHDLGAMTPLFYCFREREKIMDLCEMVSGARMFPLYFRIGGLAADLPEGFMPVAREFAKTFPTNWKDYDTLLTQNIIWKQRTIGVGTMTADEALDWGWSGPMARGSGIDWDLRRDNPYSSYEEFDFEVPLGTKTATPTPGTWCACRRCSRAPASSARPWKRFSQTEPGDIKCDDPKVSLPPKETVYTDIDSPDPPLHADPGRHPPPEGEVYQCIEAPKGEMGFYIVSDGRQPAFPAQGQDPVFINAVGLRQAVPGPPAVGHDRPDRHHGHRPGGRGQIDQLERAVSAMPPRHSQACACAEGSDVGELAESKLILGLVLVLLLVDLGPIFGQASKVFTGTITEIAKGTELDISQTRDFLYPAPG